MWLHWTHNLVWKCLTYFTQLTMAGAKDAYPEIHKIQGNEKKKWIDSDRLLRGAALMEAKSKAFISMLTYCQSVQFQQSTLLLFKCVNEWKVSVFIKIREIVRKIFCLIWVFHSKDPYTRFSKMHFPLSDILLPNTASSAHY